MYISFFPPEGAKPIQAFTAVWTTWECVAVGISNPKAVNSMKMTTYMERIG